MSSSCTTTKGNIQKFINGFKLVVKSNNESQVIEYLKDKQEFLNTDAILNSICKYFKIEDNTIKGKKQKLLNLINGSSNLDNDSDQNEKIESNDKKNDPYEQQQNRNQYKPDYLGEYFQYNSLYKQRFKHWFNYNFSDRCRRYNGRLVYNNTMLNESIRELQKEFIQNIIDIIPQSKRSNIQFNIYENNGTEDNGINTFLNQNIIKNRINAIKNNLLNASAKQLNAYYSSIALSNMDEAIDDILDGSIKIINPGKSMNKTKIKYFIGTGKGVIDSWRDDSKDYDYSKEAAKSTINIIQSTKLIVNGQEKGNLEWNQFLQTYNTIRSLRFIDLGDLQQDYYNKFGESIKYRSIQNILSGAKRNGIEEYRILFKYLSQYSGSELSQIDKQYIQSIYKNIFDSDNSNSYYSCFKNSTLQEKTEKVNYYQDVIQTLNSMENLDLQGYRIDKVGNLVNYNLVNTKRDQYLSDAQSYIASTLNSNAAIQNGNVNIIHGLNLQYDFDNDNKVINITSSINGKEYKITYRFNSKSRKANTAYSFKLEIDGIETPVNNIPHDDKFAVYTEILGKIFSIQPNLEFINTRDEFIGKDLKLATNMIYNYLVSYHILNSHKSGKLKLDDFKEQAKKFFYVRGDDTIPKVSDTFQLDMMSIGQKKSRSDDFPHFKSIINDYVSSLGVGKDNTVRDSYNNSINTVSLSQRISKMQEIWDEQGVSYDYDALAGTADFYAAYKGVAFMRDFKSRTGVNKKCVDFNFNEFFSSTFLLDYMNNLYDPNKSEFGIFGDVISDKSKLPIIMLNKYSEIDKADGTGKVTLIDATAADIALHMKKSFSLFYSNSINRIQEDMQSLSTIDISKYGYVNIDSRTGQATKVGKLNLSVDNNYQNLNNLRKINQDGTYSELSKKDMANLLHYMTAQVMKTNPNFKLNENTHYVFITEKDELGDKHTRISVNPAVIHQGLLYSLDGKLHNLTVGQWNNILGGYVNSYNCNLEQFLANKHQQLVADLLQNQMQLKLREKGAGFDHLRQLNGWYSRGKLVLAKINGINSTENSSLDIQDISDLRSWYYYKFLRSYSKKTTSEQFMYLVGLNQKLYDSLVNELKLQPSTDYISKKSNIESISNYINTLNLEGQIGLLNSLNIDGLSWELLISENIAQNFDIDRPSFNFQDTLYYAGLLSHIQKMDFQTNELKSFIRRRQFENKNLLEGQDGAITVYNSFSRRSNAINELVKNRWDHIINDIPRNLSQEDKDSIDNGNYAERYIKQFGDIITEKGLLDKDGNPTLTKNQTYAIYSYMQRMNSDQNSFIKAYISMMHPEIFDTINLRSYDEVKSIYQWYLNNNGTTLRDKYINETKNLYQKDENNDIVKDANGNNVIKSIEGLQFSMDVHPDLVKFNMLTHDYGEQFSMSTVGTFTIHPSKALADGVQNISLIEAQMYGQRTKRNVIETASKHQYSRGKLNGIGYQIKMMTIEDPHADTYNLMGENDSIEPWDGATFVNPFMDILENNSLGGNAVGTDKKQFCSSVDKRTGSGFILKTAGFSLTNARIRNAKSLIRTKNGIEVSDGKFGILMKKMTDTITWTSLIDTNPDIKNLLSNNKITQHNIKQAENGKYYIDFLIDADGNSIQFEPIYIYNPKTNKFFLRELNGFDQNTGELIYTDYQLNNRLEKLKGFTKNKISINTSYQLWKLFGGEYSGHKQDGTLTYDNDNTSVEAVVKVMNNVGIRKTSGQLNTQDDIYQIIKDSQINYAAIEGATKIASYNKNSIDIFYREDYQPTYFSIDTADLGIQLNAEHEVSGSILSLMTQVVNALGARGYSQQAADAVYKSLQTITKNNLKGLLNGINNDFNSSDHEKFKDAIAEIIINSIKKSTNTDGSIMIAIAQTLKAYNDGSVKGFDKLAGKFPFSDPALFNKLVTNIASSITKSSISIKFPGSLSVMVPSDGLIKIYNGHTAGYYADKFDELQELGNNNKEVPLSQIEMETYYKVYDNNGNDVTDQFLLQNAVELNQGYKISYDEKLGSILMNPETYFGLRKVLNKNKNYYLAEDLVAGRELRPSNTTFKDVKGNSYNIWDLDVVQNLWDLNKQLGKLGKSKKPEDKKLIPDIKEQIIEKRKELQECLNALGSGKEQSVKINNIDVIVDKNSVEVRPYELIMGKVYQDQFGLEEGVELNNIDTKYFIKKLLNKTTSNNIDQNKFDIELKHINGKSTILKYKENPNPNIQSRWINNKLYRVDVLGNKMYDIPDANIEVQVDNNGNEIIYTNNLQYFIKAIQPSNIIVSTNNVESFQRSMQALKESGDKQAMRLYSKIIGEEDNVDWDKAMKQYISYYKDIKTNLSKFEQKILKATDLQKLFKDRKFWEQYSNFSEIINSARELNTSFKESLKFIATRTPAQSHQSFMAMKVVGFDNSGKNSAYVSRWQIWLQGSDYDIDKVSLLGKTINRSGKLEYWSPFQNLKNEKSWNAGEQIEFPTGNEISNISETDFNDGISNIVLGESKKEFNQQELSKVIGYFNNILKNNVKHSTNHVFNNTGQGYKISKNGEYINLNQKGKFNQYDNTLILLQALKNISESGQNLPIKIISKDKATLSLVLDALDIDYEEDSKTDNIIITQESISKIKPSNIFKAINNGALSYLNSDSKIEDTDSIDYLDYYDNVESQKDLKRLVNKISRRSSNIKIISDIISLYNSMSGVPNIDSSINFFSRLVDYHNTYFKDNKNKELNAAQNFIASQMYNIMTSPDNIIQGSTSIDDPTKIIKKLTTELEFNRLAGQIDNFDPGSVSSKFLQVVLTLSGRANTANAASAMKKFEAISAAYNKILNSYGENYYALVSNLEILGKELKLMANTYVNDDSKLPDDIKQYLANVDQNTDAFIQLSTILSLSTDNAKDPTLSKINCGPDMLGLYTAGIMAGLDIRTLVKLMLSDTGIMLQNVMNGNIVTGDSGFDRVSKALSFLKNGPVNKLKESSKVQSFISDAYTVFYLKSAPKDAFGLQRGIIGNGNNYSITRARGFLRFLQRATSNKSRQKAKVNEYLNSITISQLLNAAKKDLEYQISKLPKKKQNSEEANKLKNKLYQINNLRYSEDFLNQNISSTQLSDGQKYNQHYNKILPYIKPYMDCISRMRQSRAFSEYEQNTVYDVIDLENKYISSQFTIKNNTITGEDGVEYNIFEQLSKLSKLNDEIMKVNKVCKLNQGLPTNLSEFISLVQGIQNLLITSKYSRAEKQALEKQEGPLWDLFQYNTTQLEYSDSDKHKIDIIVFATNKKYRDLVIAAYDTVKDYLNIPIVWSGNDHYLGYMLCLGLANKVYSTSMAQFRELSEYQNSIVRKYYANSDLNISNKAFKNISTYLFQNRINIYLRNSIQPFNVNTKFYDKTGKLSDNEEIKSIVLGTQLGNKNFKYWMDNKVFPWLQQGYSNNDFVKDLTKVEYQYNLDGIVTINYATKARTQFNNPQEQERFQRAKLGLLQLSNIKYDGCDISITDLIYLYNQIAYSQSYGKNNFTNLFEDIIANGNDQIINNYINYININDFRQSDIKLSKVSIDSVLRLICPKVRYVSQLTSLKTPYAMVRNDFGEYQLVVNKKYLEDLKKEQAMTQSELDNGGDYDYDYEDINGEDYQDPDIIDAELQQQEDSEFQKETFEQKLSKTQYKKITNNNSITSNQYYEGDILIVEENGTSVIINPAAQSGTMYNSLDSFISDNRQETIKSLYNKGYFTIEKDGLNISDIFDLKLSDIISYDSTGKHSINLNPINNIIDYKQELDNTENTCKL